MLEKKKLRNYLASNNTGGIIGEANFKTIMRQFMCISSTKNMITSDASRYNLGNYIFVGLKFMLR